jgi:hypothetical protein
MRLLASITATVGCLLLSVGTLGVYTTLTDWDILGRTGAIMGLQPDHWRGHWLGTAVAYFALGFGVPLFRRRFVASFAPHSDRVVYHSQRALGSLACSLFSSAFALWISADSLWRGCLSHSSQHRQLVYRSASACQNDQRQRARSAR